MGRATATALTALLLLPACLDSRFTAPTNGVTSVLPHADTSLDVRPAKADALLELPEEPAAIANDCQKAPGSSGCPCIDSAACLSGACVEFPDGMRCAATCGGNCPSPDQHCVSTTTGPDLLYLCVAKVGRLCVPCDSSGFCSAALGQPQSACIRYGDQLGAFCGVPCAADSDCPGEFSCKTASTVEGTVTRQCVRNNLQCPCTTLGAMLASTTSCANPGAPAHCQGQRRCLADGGLSACEPLAPQLETCNGVDDDCDGQIDNDVDCDDGDACTSDTCVASACTHAALPESYCDDGSACTVDACQAGTCTHEALTGVSCEDGNSCTNDDVCTSGECVGAPLLCDDGSPCTMDACFSAQGCVFAPTAGNCDADGLPCTVDACQNGTCQPAALPAEHCCDGVDNDCDGQTDECGTTVQIQYDAPSAATTLQLVLQAAPNGPWTTTSSPGPALSVERTVCPQASLVRFNIGWANPVNGHTWACSSDGVGGSEVVSQVPSVDVSGIPAAVSIVPADAGPGCELVFALVNGKPADPVVARPGELLISGHNLGNADCAMLVGEHGAWLSGPVSSLQPNGFYSFKLPGGQLPAGVWRFNAVIPIEGCGAAGSTGTIAPGKSVLNGGAWAADIMPGASLVGAQWAWSGDTMEWGAVIPSSAWRMLVQPTGVVLPAGTKSPLDPSVAYCKPGAMRACASSVGCNLVQTCLQRNWLYEAVAPTSEGNSWPASYWSVCSPPAASLPLTSWDACGDGLDADCDGVDELCSPLLSNGFDGLEPYGLWSSWTGNTGAVVQTSLQSAVNGAKALLIEVQLALAEFWSVQVQHKNVNVVQGQSYRLSFWAAADKPRVLRAVLEHPETTLVNGQVSEVWLGDGLAIDVDLAPGMRRYEVNFIATSTGSRQLNFQFAQAKGKVWIDNIKLASL